MAIRHCQRCSRALVALTLVMGAAAVGVSPVAASNVTPQATRLTCGPKSSTHHPASGVGGSATYAANGAGTVTLLRQTQTSLKVTDADSRSGWQSSVVTRAGTRVHVGFQRVGDPHEQERFFARLNSTGTVITIVTQTCT